MLKAWFRYGERQLNFVFLLFWLSFSVVLSLYAGFHFACQVTTPNRFMLFAFFSLCEMCHWLIAKSFRYRREQICASNFDYIKWNEHFNENNLFFLLKALFFVGVRDDEINRIQKSSFVQHIIIEALNHFSFADINCQKKDNINNNSVNSHFDASIPRTRIHQCGDRNGEWCFNDFIQRILS